MSIQKIPENIKLEEDFDPIGFEKISVISDIENYISYMLNKEIDNEKETLKGNPDLNFNTINNKNDNKQIIQNYFGHIASKNIDSEIMMTSLNIINDLEKYLKSKDKSLSFVEGKKKWIEKFVNHWFFTNKDQRNIKAWENYIQKKQLLEALNKILPTNVKEEFFSVRGNVDERKEVLIKYKNNIQEAIKKFGMSPVANYLNLDLASFIGLWERHLSEELDALKLNIENNIILQAIDMLEKGYLLKTVLKTIWKNHHIKLYEKAFWQLAQKIDIKYTPKWYSYFYTKHQQNMLEQAEKILGKETTDYLKKTCRLSYEIIEPYSEKLKEALKTCGYQVVSKLLNKNKYNFRKTCKNHFPEWWKEHMP